MEKVYNTLPLEGDEIRILTLCGSSEAGAQIQCKLKKVSLKENPSYVALSYAWGTQLNNSDILVDDQKFSATANLQDALQHFRKKDTNTGLWVDAICINQKNAGEKLKQIDLMRKIFSKAEETWVWLGLERDESNKAIGLIKLLSEKILSHNQNPEYTETVRWGFRKTWGVEDKLVALENLFVRDYWYRIWIVQEIAVSKTLTLFCGAGSFSWDEVFDAAYFIDGAIEVKEIIREHRVILSRKTSTRGLRETLPGGRDIQAGIQRIISIQSVRNDILKNERDLKAEPPDSLLFLLSNHRSTGATEPVDKYFALAGLVEDDLPPSEGPVKDVYIWAALSTAKQQQASVEGGLALDFLDCAGLPINKKVEDLPSWVPDWSYYQRRAIPLLHWQFSGKKDKDKVYFNAPGRGIGHVSTKYDPSIRHPVFFTEKLVTRTTQIHPAAIGHASGQGSLSAHGLQLDEVNGTGFSEWSSFAACKVQNPKEPQKCPIGKYPTGEDLEDVVWKTCVLNRTARGQKPPSQWGELFHVYNYRQQWYNNNKGFKICGRTLEEITLDALEKMRSQTLKTSGVIVEDIADKELARQHFISGYNPEGLNLLSMAFGIATGRRRLATTKLGYLCMAPFDTQLGDIIAVLYDCHAPVVLREEKSHYRFIGTCYIHGIMHGEVAKMDGLNSKWFDIQ
jgi:hypothetical protein